MRDLHTKTLLKHQQSEDRKTLLANKTNIKTYLQKIRNFQSETRYKQPHLFQQS